MALLGDNPDFKGASITKLARAPIDNALKLPMDLANGITGTNISLVSLPNMKKDGPENGR